MCRQSQKVNSAPQKFAALGSKPHSCTSGDGEGQLFPKGCRDTAVAELQKGTAPGRSEDPKPSSTVSLRAVGRRRRGPR